MVRGWSGDGQGMVRGWSGDGQGRSTHPNVVIEALTAIAFAIAAAPASPISLRPSPSSVTEALTSSAFAIAIAPWSPMLLLYNLQKASRSGDGQEGFVKSEQVVRGWSGGFRQKASAP